MSMPLCYASGASKTFATTEFCCCPDSGCSFTCKSALLANECACVWISGCKHFLLVQKLKMFIVRNISNEGKMKQLLHSPSKDNSCACIGGCHIPCHACAMRM